MRLSRLRLGLTLRFGATVALVLGVLVVALVVYLHRESSARLTAELEALAGQLVPAVQAELAEDGAEDLVATAHDELAEFYPGFGVLMLFGDAGLLHAIGPEAQVRALGDALGPHPVAEGPRELPVAGGDDLRVVVARAAEPLPFAVVAARSTRVVVAETRPLLRWLGLGVPLGVVLSAIAGYVLAGRALAPLDALRASVERLGPDRLEDRLEVRDPPDEIDRLAAQTNALLERLEQARRRNQRFLADVAHQLRTPLTVARGETTLALERERSPDDYRAALRRVRSATEQMGRRVDDLLLLAQAEIGMVPPPTERVELDGLAVDCCDFMRSRASVLGRGLELARAESVEVIGSEPLLREALVELIENGLRHGDAGAPVRVSAYGLGDAVCLEVATVGAPLDPEPEVASPPDAAGGGLGLSIVRWIASFHGGALELLREDERNRFRLRLPGAAPSDEPARA